jgi:hypothetical protein
MRRRTTTVVTVGGEPEDSSFPTSVLVASHLVDAKISAKSGSN